MKYFCFMATGKFNDIELLWIREVLDQHGEYIVDLLQEAIENKNLIKEGDLQESLDYKTDYKATNPKLSISFLSYGRAIEINFHKRSKNTKTFLKPNTNQVVWGIRSQNKIKKKKDTNFYSRNVYGSLNRLIGIIMYELGDQEIARLKNILEHQKLLTS